MLRQRILGLIGLAIFLIFGSAASAANPYLHYFDCKNCHFPNATMAQMSENHICLKCHSGAVATSPNDKLIAAPAYARIDSASNGVFSTGDASASFGHNPSPVQQTSHNWSALNTQPAAGAREPNQSLYTGFYSRYGASLGKVTCSRCHNPHGEAALDADEDNLPDNNLANPKLLVADASNGNKPMEPEKMCRACHEVWANTNDHGWLTHPLIADYAAVAGTKPGYKPAQSIVDAAVQAATDGRSAVNLISYQGATGVGCLSCHAVHYADSDAGTADGVGHSLNNGDGRLLRADGAGRADTSALCQSCHIYQLHGDQSGERVGCLVCHSGHSYDPSLPNYFILRKTATTQTYGTKSSLDYSSPGVLNEATKYLYWNDLTSSTANGYCEKCHGDAQVIPDGGGGYHTTTAVCTNCHSHGRSGEGSFLADCIGCHSVAQGNRAAVVGQFNGNSHHVQGTAVTNQHCYQCHWEADSSGKINPTYHSGSPGASVDLVVYGAGTRPITYTAGATAIQYTANGNRSEIAELNTHCLGCHSNASDSFKPFGDGKTPKHYAWDGTTIDSRYSQPGTIPWGKYSGNNTTPKSSQTKAYSAHGNATVNQGGWDLGETWTNTRNGTVSVACYDCHNSHGSKVEGTTTSYASATDNGGLLKDTSSGKGGYLVSYKPAAGGTTTDKNQHNPGASLCMDCHMNADGSGSQPWGYQSTFGATARILGYYDPPNFASGGSGSQTRYPYKAAAGYKGGHFGASSELGGDAMGAIDGLCTPCHDPHGVSPTLGSNQQYGVPLLKGTWLTSPYKEDVAPEYPWNERGAPWGNDVHVHIDQNTFGGHFNQLVSGITQTDAQFAGLCLNCHPKDSLTKNGAGSPNSWKSKDRVHEAVKGWKTSNGTVKHNYPCSKCHSPHNGSALPRLMISNCMDWSHKGRVASTTGATPSGSYSECGGGNGRIPGVYDYSTCDDWGYGYNGSYSTACHEVQNSHALGDADQSWNLVTPWAPLTITSPPVVQNPAASSSIPGKTQITIAWGTNLPSDSAVDYGLTASYGQTVTNGTLTTSHAVVLNGLDNHTVYHYRIRSGIPSSGQLVASGDQVVTINVPPTLGTLASDPVKFCSSSCPVTLSWSAAQAVDGCTVQYYAEVDDDANFGSINANSGWISGTSWSPTVATNKTWYWRLKARDAGQTLAVSAWSDSRAFQVQPLPVAPTLTDEPNLYCSGNCSVVLAWSPVPNPNPALFGAVQYYLEIDDVPTFDGPNKQTSGWVITTSATIVSLASEKLWYFRGKSRYANFAESTSAWSNFKTMSIYYDTPSAPLDLSAPVDTICPGGCSIPLSWSPSTSNGGGPFEYSVEVDDDPTFASPDASSGWASGTSWSTGTLGPDKTWFWRVQARDVNYVEVVSAWSNSSFRILEAAPPAKNITFAWDNVPSNSINIDGTLYGGTGSVVKTVTTSFAAEIVGSPGQEGGGDPDPDWYYYAGRAPGGNPGYIAAIFTPSDGNSFTIKVGSVGEYRATGGYGGGASYVAKDNTTVMYAAGAGGGGGGEATFDDSGEKGGYIGDPGEGFGSAMGGYGGAGSWDWAGDGYAGQPGGDGGSGSAGVTPTTMTGDIYSPKVTITLN